MWDVGARSSGAGTRYAHHADSQINEARVLMEQQNE